MGCTLMCAEFRELLVGFVWTLGTKLTFSGLTARAFTFEPCGWPTFEIVFRCLWISQDELA